MIAGMHRQRMARAKHCSCAYHARWADAFRRSLGRTHLSIHWLIDHYHSATASKLHVPGPTTNRLGLHHKFAISRGNRADAIDSPGQNRNRHGTIGMIPAVIVGIVSIAPMLGQGAVGVIDGGAVSAHHALHRQMRDEFVRRLPRTTLVSHVSGRDEYMYAYSGTFTPNPGLIGTWAWAVWLQPSNPSEIDGRISNFMKANNGNGPDKIEKPKDVIQFLDGGKIAKSRFFGGYFWSGDMLVGINDDRALKMEIRMVHWPMEVVFP